LVFLILQLSQWCKVQ